LNDADQILEIRLHGNNIAPTTFKSKEVGEIIDNLENALKVYILASHHDLDDKELFISPVKIENNSLHLFFLPNVRALFIAAFTSIGSAIAGNNYAAVPPKSIEALRSVQKVVRAKNCYADFIYNGNVLASIDANTDIVHDINDIISGETTIYGIVQRVGGADPTAWIKLTGGQRIIVNVTESIAKTLAKNLYEEIGFKGEARWSISTNQIVEFKLSEIVKEYSYTPANEAFKKLREAIGDYWDRENINDYL